MRLSEYSRLRPSLRVSPDDKMATSKSNSIKICTLDELGKSHINRITKILFDVGGIFEEVVEWFIITICLHNE